MQNNAIVERIYTFQKLISSKNWQLGAALGRATIPLLEYRKDLARASRDDLLNLPGIGEKSVDLVLRVIQGEDLGAVAKDVPVLERNLSQRAPGQQVRDRGNWDGSWDDAVRHYESE